VTADGPVVSPVREKAADLNCYIVCPVHEERDGRIFNTSLVFDRNGELAGRYDKLYPTELELKHDIVPGKLGQETIDTDFGPLGCRICFDANWESIWKSLVEAGAGIIAFSSGYAAGWHLNALALLHHVWIIAATIPAHHRVLDPTGRTVAEGGRLRAWVSAQVYPDFGVFHWDFQEDAVDRIVETYGRNLKVELRDDEGWFLLYGTGPGPTVAEVADEFDLTRYRDYIARAEAACDECRDV
jgi:predicted amidohydrolase